MYESLTVLDSLQLNFNAQGVLIINVTLAFIMFGVALEIKLEHFKRVITRPKATIIGFVSQFAVLPAVTFGVVWLLRDFITPSVALGMILVSACPGGNISNFMSFMAKGNTELSISLTAIATLVAVFMTPLNFALWGGLYNASSPLLVPLEIPFIQMLKTVFILLGIPLVMGMLFAWKFPYVTQKIAKPLKTISIIIFMAIVLLAFANNFDHFVNYIKYIFIIVLFHNAIALTTGYSFSSLFGIKEGSRRSITIETGIQNSGLALALIFNPKIFPETLQIGGMAFIAAWWGIWHIISGLGIASFWSRKPLLKDSFFNTAKS